MSQQSLRQASIRAVTSTTYTYEGDWHALWDLLGIAAGQFNERMLAYINNQLSASYTELNGAMAAFAAEHGSTTFQAIGTFTPGFSLTAPVLAFASATDPDSDNTQDFNATVFEDIEGYYVRLVGSYGATTVSEPYDIDQFNLIDGSEAVLLLATFLTGAIPNGDVAFKCRIQSGAGDGTGTPVSDWSNTVTKEIDQALPTLSSPVDTAVSDTTASGTVTTDILGGTLYAVITTSATTPSAAQIKAGQTHTGAAAADAVSQAVTTTGVQTITGGFTGLTTATAYYAHYVQETVNGFSNAVTGDGFTTDAATSAEVSQYLGRATGMDATHIDAFTELIDGLVADDVWDDLDALYIFATDTEAHAKLNVKSSSFDLTETGTVTWSADVGYTNPGGASHYLDTGFNPSAAGGVFTLNSASLFAWINTNTGFNVAIGVYDGTRVSQLYGSGGDGNAYGRLNSNAFNGISVSNGGVAGSWLITRTASNALALYKNGSSVVTGTTATTALPNANIYVTGQYNNGTPQGAGYPMSVAAIGAGLDATKALALHNRVATYRTAVGL